MNFLFMIVIVALVVGIVAFHITRSQNVARGDICDTYPLSVCDRLIGFIPLFYLSAIACVVILVDGFVGEVELISKLLTGRPDILPPILLFFPLILWAIILNYRFKLQLVDWLNLQELRLVRFERLHSWDNPWGRSESGILSGHSESQSCYKVLLRDVDEKERTAYILWGGYFGFECLIGYVPVNLVWEKVDDSERILDEAMLLRKRAEGKDPNDLLKPRW